MVQVTGNYLSKALGLNMLKIFGAGLAATAVCLLTYIPGLHLPGGKFAFILPMLLCFAVYIAIIWFSGVLKIVLPKRASQEN